MQIEILGSGGAIPSPLPGCNCRVCTEGRAKGAPYSRTGPSVFVHGLDVLIDTPEESKFQLNRAGIGRVAACLYSHWHPDHVLGRRVWESLNGDWMSWPSHHRCTDIYLPQQVAQDFRDHLGSWEQYTYMQKVGLVRLIELADGDVISLDAAQIRPFRLAEDYVYAFLLEWDGRRVLIAPDELHRWNPPAGVCGVDLAIIPMGLPVNHPLTGELLIPPDHPVLDVEATYEQTLDIVRTLDARHVVMMHVELDTFSYDDLKAVEADLRRDGYAITFAYDTMKIEV
ncbi:MAG: hypothetical protein JXJ20_09430 [Anaerolineae bacterium]|nr:hypothetical protein [Anaerolineae bacterium]